MNCPIICAEVCAPLEPALKRSVLTAKALEQPDLSTLRQRIARSVNIAAEVE
jgi:hypothetical protein